MEKSDLSAIGRRYSNFMDMDDNEQLVCEIKKHPFGLLLVWLVGLFIAVAVLTVTIVSLWALTGDHFGVGSDLDVAKPIVGVIGFILVVLVLIATGISSYIYRHNVILVTSDKIAEITYVSIFNRKITQLDLADIQDVAVEQKGIFPRIFGYGTLLIETAGELENVLFTYAPYPYKCAKEIVNARETRKGYGARQAQQAYQMPPMPPAPLPPQ